MHGCVLCGGRLIRILCAVAALVCCATVFRGQTKADSARAPFVADGLGKGAVSLDGPWQFHLGDNSAWASADADDATGHNGWEQLSAAKPWGTQGHKGYTGFAWYRRRVSITLAPGASADVALYVPPINDAYQVYWNGVLVGHHGKMPPHPIWYYLPVSETMSLGHDRSGVLAVRVWRAELTSSDSDAQGGFVAAPSIGSPPAIGALKTGSDYRWLSRHESLIMLDGLYFLVGSIALLAWLRDRHMLLFWMAACDITVVTVQLLELYRFPIPYVISVEMAQPLFGFASVSTWYLLALLLRLDESRIIWRSLRVLAIVAMAVCVLDALATYAIGVVSGKWIAWTQGADWILSAIYNVEQLLPTPLVVCAAVRRRRLSAERWVVAFFFLMSNLVPVFESVLAQSSRFAPEQWLSDLLFRPLFTINGAVIDAQALTAALLLFAIVFAVYRITREEHRRQIAVEQEFKSARELQRVLIPEEQPLTPGYTLTSSYKPASEVGGDFFQVVALKNDSTLIVLGDVSGKGLKAAMAVSLIVGMIRALASIFPEPGKLLAEINKRLAGRLDGSFATALVLCLDPQGGCTVASAGHLSPFVNEHELEMPGALPLGICAEIVYEDSHVQLKEGDQLVLYTDGLLEARNGAGELYGFERLNTLFTSRPNAGQVLEAAVSFGQDDDITVLTLTKLGVGKASAPQRTAPILSPA
jgi:Stage II sporulation protein E (SpoIIE)